MQTLNPKLVPFLNVIRPHLPRNHALMSNEVTTEQVFEFLNKFTAVKEQYKKTYNRTADYVELVLIRERLGPTPPGVGPFKADPITPPQYNAFQRCLNWFKSILPHRRDADEKAEWAEYKKAAAKREMPIRSECEEGYTIGIKPTYLEELQIIGNSHFRFDENGQFANKMDNDGIYHDLSTDTYYMAPVPVKDELDHEFADIDVREEDNPRKFVFYKPWTWLEPNWKDEYDALIPDEELPPEDRKEPAKAA